MITFGPVNIKPQRWFNQKSLPGRAKRKPAERHPNSSQTSRQTNTLVDSLGNNCSSFFARKRHRFFTFSERGVCDARTPSLAAFFHTDLLFGSD
jgi:hypothetical protein